MFMEFDDRWLRAVEIEIYEKYMLLPEPRVYLGRICTSWQALL